MLAFSNDYYGLNFRAKQSVELFCAYDGTDVNSIMRDMMSIILEGALDQELDEELGYSKYDYRNKETDNSRNGHSQKTLHTSYGDMEIDIPRDRKVTSNHRL